MYKTIYSWRYLLHYNVVLQLTLCTVLYSFLFSSSPEVMMSYSSFGSVLYIYFYVAKDIFRYHILFSLDCIMTTSKNLLNSILIVPFLITIIEYRIKAAYITIIRPGTCFRNMRPFINSSSRNFSSWQASEVAHSQKVLQRRLFKTSLNFDGRSLIIHL